jgi:hypothetical protein
MKLRSDSPFAKLTRTQMENMAELSKTMTAEQMMKVLEGAPEKIHCTLPALRRFLQRLREEEFLKDVVEAKETVESLAKHAEDGKVRDATLATMRQRMFENAFETNNRELIMEMFRELNEEKAREREAALEERRVKALEEATKIRWRKLEAENARAGLKLLPRIREILMDASVAEGERVRQALEFLVRDGGALLTLGEG